MAPDYARTAYNSQGMTLPAAIVDLCFDENMDPATAYVSLSRVKVADDILIMQAFNLKPFTQGSPLGPRLLLKKLRGEDIQPDIDQHLEQERQQREEERIAKAEAAQAKEAKQTERAAKKRERDNRKYDAMPEQEKAKRHKGAKERLDKSPQAAERKKQQDQDHERDRKRPKRDRTDRVITIDQRERRRLAAERYRERMRSQWYCHPAGIDQYLRCFAAELMSCFNDGERVPPEFVHFSDALLSPFATKNWKAIL